MERGLWAPLYTINRKNMANILSLKNLTKIYPNGKIANREISFDIEENTIHAIVGENGAGKSTLVNMIFGVHQPTAGQIYFKGEEVKFVSPNDAIKVGIGMVHQHFMLAPDLTVAENMLLGMESTKYHFFLNYKEMISKAQEVCEEYGLAVNPKRLIKDIPIGIRQRVEILKALVRNAEVLILDEPTAVLAPQEVDVLFKTLRKLKENGKTILFISHKLNEVKAISDKITVMKDAKVVVTKDTAQLEEQEIAKLMVGRDVIRKRNIVGQPRAEILLALENVNYIDQEGLSTLKNINLELRGGEILGVAGVEGNGQSELSRVITGLMKPTSGTIKTPVNELTNLSPREIRKSGLSHIPEDRMENGIAASMSLEENFIAERYYKKEFRSGLFLSSKAISKHAELLIADFNILTQSPKSAIASLSGGNIQKAIVARELTSDPSVIIAAQPTRGVDIGSEAMIHNLLVKMRNEGKGILLISADLDEILTLSDRVVVMYEGEIVAQFTDVETLTDKDVGPYMLGIERQEAPSGKVLN